VGKSRPAVANSLRLLRLPGEVLESLESGSLSPGHARALLSVDDEKLRDRLFREIAAKGLSVREAEKRASVLNAPPAENGYSGEKPEAKRPPEIVELEEKFIERLGTKVSIEGGIDKGRIHIEYYTMEDLDRLYGILGGGD
jgi:ParB family chromosome partitioning protein